MNVKSMGTMRATLLLLGTIVGAGIFAVPSMIGAWGFIPSTIAIVLLTGILTIVHLYYAEAILRGKKRGHLMGRATYWLGPVAGRFAGAIQSLQIFGSCLAYLILGGEFLSWFGNALQLPLLVWQVLFWCMGALIVLFGLKAVARAESLFTWLLVFVIVVIVCVFMTDMRTEFIWLFPSTWSGFEPYGVFLFALMGIVGMPEAAELVEYRADDLRRAVIWSTLSAAALTYAYGVSSWMASGGSIGRDAIGVVAYLPQAIAFIIPLFGFLAIITSFISSSLDLNNLFQKDGHASALHAWLIALGVPLLLLFATPRDFLATVGFVGSLFGASIATIVVWMGAAAMRKERERGKDATLWLKTSLIPWMITIIFVASGILWLASPSAL